MTIRPKERFVQSSRELIAAPQTTEQLLISGIIISTHPDVFHPGLFFSSRWFAEEVARRVKGETVLIEVGCGTGLVALAAAKANPALMVYATDASGRAAEVTAHNAKQNHLVKRVKAYSGDVLDAIPDMKADTIFWSLPFGYLGAEDPMSPRDDQVFDRGYRAIRKFFSTASRYLSEHGRLLVGFSRDIGHWDLLEQIAMENGFKLGLVAETKGVEKEAVSMELYEARRLD